MPRQVQLCSWLRSEADVHVCLVCCCFFELSQHDESISEFVRSRLQTLCNFLLIYSVFHSIKLWFSIENLSFLLWGALVNRDYSNQLLRAQSGFIKKQLGLPFFETIRWPQVSRLWRFLPPPQFLWYSCFISFSLLYWLMGNLFRFSKFGARETRGNISIRIGRQTHTTSNPLSRWVTEYMHLRANRSLGFFSVTSFPEGFFPSSVCVCVVGTTQKRPQKDQPVYYSFFSMNQFFIFSIAPPIIWLVKGWINNEHRHCL